jgi:hypothetical protein
VARVWSTALAGHHERVAIGRVQDSGHNAHAPEGRYVRSSTAHGQPAPLAFRRDALRACNGIRSSKTEGVEWTTIRKQALKAASSAKRAAAHATRAAQIMLASAEGDKVRANHDVEEAQEAEEAAGKRFHTSQQRGFPRDPA